VRFLANQQRNNPTICLPCLSWYHRHFPATEQKGGNKYYYMAPPGTETLDAKHKVAYIGNTTRVIFSLYNAILFFTYIASHYTARDLKFLEGLLGKKKEKKFLGRLHRLGA
jgi:hypothetical protein